MAPPAASTYDFRRIHHYHAFPGPPRLLAWNDPSHTGDHTAATRILAPLGMGLSRLSRVLPIGPAHFALGGALGLAWGFGLRQSIHSLVLGRRALARLKLQVQVLEAAIKKRGPAVHTAALRRRLSTLKNQTRYQMMCDAIGGVGSAMLGITYLSRAPLLGHALPGFAHASLALLHAALPPLIIPIAVGCAERSGRALYTRHRIRRMHRYLETVAHPEVKQVDALYRARQNELAKLFASDALARAGACVGACVSVFVGPAGLIVLIPCIVGLMVVTCFTRRVLRVDDAWTEHDKKTLDEDHKFIDAVVDSRDNVARLEALRSQRYRRYPKGWGTRFRPLVRLYRYCRYHTRGSGRTSERVLAAYGQRRSSSGERTAIDPQWMLEILDTARVRAQFAKAVLKDRALRASLTGRGVTMAGRKWSVDTDRVAITMRESQWQRDPDRLASRLYQLAEEVLLTFGKTEGWRRLRALLDAYGRFAKQRLTAQHEHKHRRPGHKPS